MRIVVNDIAASTGGAMTVLRDFYNCVCDSDKENEWIFLLNDRYFKETDNVKIMTLPEIKKSRVRKLLFDLVTGKKYIQALDPDVVFSLQNTLTFGLKKPQALYIHQPIPFQNVKHFSFLRTQERKLAVIQYLIGWIIKRSAKKSDCVIVQTKWMKEAVCRICGLSEGKVHTNLPDAKWEQPVQTAVSYEKTTFFYPTSDVIYKNSQCILKASQMLSNRGIDHVVTLTLSPEQTNGNVIYVGRLPYDEVMAHYQKSTLVFPSYIETFGYPLAEARMAGAIVLAADTPFAREVLDGYENAYFFDPFKPEELATLMEQVAVGELEKKDVAFAAPTSTGSWEQVIQWVLELGAGE